MRGNSAASYVEKPRLGASGLKNDARKSHWNEFSAGNFWIAPQKSLLNFRRGKGSRLVEGTRLVVFPRPNRPRSEKATSRNPSRAGTPCPFPKRCRRGRGVPERVPARRGVGVLARGILRLIRCQAAWEYHEPGPFGVFFPLFYGHSVQVEANLRD